MNFLFIGYNIEKQYSGGRYHAWIMAQALVHAGNSVEYWTNVLPYFTFDFDSREYQESIQMDFSLNSKFLKKGNYDYMILVPGGGSKFSSIYHKAVHTAYINKSKMVLLNFESPNWYNSMSPIKKNLSIWKGWELVAKYSSIILSSANESNKFAKEYYRVSGNTSFEFCSPSINSFAVNDRQVINKLNEVVIITRFDSNSMHKGGNDILKLFDKRLSQYKFKFIVGMGLEQNIKDILIKKSEETGIKVELLYKLNDNEKFIEIQKAKFMIFLSKFEGMGYPPIESLYAGTKCITYKLPVFYETCGDCLEYVDYDDYESIIKKLLSTDFNLSKNCVNTIRDKHSFESYSKNLSRIFNNSKYKRPSFKKKEMVVLMFQRIVYMLFNAFEQLLIKFLPLSMKKLIKKMIVR